MKRLLPSLREKKRYIAFEVESKASTKTIVEALQAHMQSFLGTVGMSKANPIILQEKWKGKKGIIRVNHNWKDEVIVSLGLLTWPVHINQVSGILKKMEGY